MTTLIHRCLQAHHDSVGLEAYGVLSTRGARAVIEHIAAELNHAGHQDAARWLLSQLRAEVIPLRPDQGGAA